MSRSPVGPHSASPAELQEQLAADRAGAPYLIYRDAEDRQRIFALPEDGRSLTVGRGLSCDVALVWEQSVSRAHAQLERLGDEWVLVDDGLSRNGSWVNGERVQGRRRLGDGDVMRFGEALVVFRAPMRVGQETAPAHETPAEYRLSEAQRRVLLALCRPFAEGTGFATPPTNAQLAEELFLSVDGIKTHMRALFERFALEDVPQSQKRTRLVEAAFSSGVVSRRDFE